MRIPIRAFMSVPVLVMALALPAQLLAEDRPAATAVKTFTKPKIGGKYVDWCHSLTGGCGRMAADAFCRKKGLAGAKRYVKAKDKTYDTRYLKGGQTCKNPLKCDWFYKISCTVPVTAKSGKTNRPKVNADGLITKYFKWNDYDKHRMDFCATPTGKCGFRAATEMCKRKGYQFAINYTKASSLNRRTRYVSTGGRCLNPLGCNWMYSVSCGSYGNKPKLTKIGQSERALVILVADLKGNFPHSDSFPQNLDPKFWMGNLYHFIENEASGIAMKRLARQYDSVTTVFGRNATPEKLVQALKRAASQRHIKAVDLIFVTHGSDNGLSFSDGKTVSTGNLIYRMRHKKTGLTPAEAAKLRAVFSTACFGKSHNAAWLSSGFKVVAGANQVYTDAALSYEPMLTAWAKRRSFRFAVDVANRADERDLFDSGFDLAIGKGLVPAFRQFRGKVDSTRVVQGEGRLTIDTMPR